MRRKTTLSALAGIAVSLVVLLVGCAGGGSSSGANKTTAANVQNGGGRGSMSARIDGNQWSAARIVQATYANGVLSVSGADGSNPPRAIGFAVTTDRPGTFQIGPQGSPAANAVLTDGRSVWQAVPFLRGTGTITITSLTSTGASGTFSFTGEAVPQTSASGTRVITAGVFSVTFSGSLELPSTASAAAPAGVTAQINGTAWSGSLQSQGSNRNRFLSIVGSDSKYSIQLGISQFTGPGTYSLDYLNKNGSIAIVGSTAGGSWTTAVQGGQGSVVITTLTTTTVTGTFSFDAGTTAGSTPATLHVTNGQFAVALH